MRTYRKQLKQTSRTLRSNMTDAEQVLWQRLRRKQICGVQFYRQKPLLGVVVDFFSAKAGLVVEVDGGQHFETEHLAKDTVRDRALAELGLHVLRFDNRQVLVETEAVVAEIERIVKGRVVQR